MNNTKPTLDDLRTEIALNDVLRAIDYARLRCLSFADVLDHLSKADDGHSTVRYIARLSEMTLTEPEWKMLLSFMNSMAKRAEDSTSRYKARIDSMLRQLLRPSATEFANQFAEPFAEHKRKGPRQWLYLALRHVPISSQLASRLAKAFLKTGDQEALELIARNPQRVAELNPRFLLSNLKERYWRARVLEALITYDRPQAIILAAQYPFEFAHAVGRSQDKSMFDLLVTLYRENSNNLDFVGIYAYALGKIGADKELELLSNSIAAWVASINSVETIAVTALSA
jgi:hypothetical protein